jgi:hypothetical protein
MTNKPRPLTTRSVTESTSRTILIHFNEEGWASYTINDDTGEVTIQSDWGTWAYRWHVDHTGYRTMVEAVCGFNNHYITDKMHYGRRDREEPDADETRKCLCEGIIQGRREGRLDRDKARELWDAAIEFFDILEEGNADIALARADECLWKWCPDLYESIMHQPTHSFLMLRDQLIPALQRHLAPEVAAMKAERAAD